MKTFLSTAFVFLLAQSVMAKDVLISTVTSDVDKVEAKLWVVTTDDGSAKELKITTNDGDGPSKFGTGSIKTGMVLKQVDDYKVVTIKSDDFEVDRGGHFELSYLTNGITGSRSSKEIEIEFDGATWKLFHNGRAASRFHFKGRKIFGKLVGIKDVEIR